MDNIREVERICLNFHEAELFCFLSTLMAILLVVVLLYYANLVSTNKTNISH